MATLALTGDVMLGRGVRPFIATEPPTYVWGTARPRMLEADARLVNLECVIATCGEPVQPKVFHFRAIPETIAALQAARVDLVSLANNHVLDYGPDALVEMLDRLDAAHIPRAGAGRDADDAGSPAFLDVNGLRVGVLAFTDNEPDWAAAPGRPGTAYADVDGARGRVPDLERRIAALAEGADAVVVSAHWGPNMRRRPPRAFRRLADRVLDAGATVFWGHSAHLFQGIEARGRRVILYDAGDFVDDYRVDPDERNDLGFLFRVDVTPEGVRSVHLHPTQVDPRACRIVDPSPADAAWARARMRALSAELGTSLAEADDGLHLDVMDASTTAHA